MPELPEVETLKRQLGPELAGRTIESLRVIDAKWAEPADARTVEDSLRGRRIAGLERRGKYLLLALDRGETLVVHLRMTGNLLLAAGANGRRLTPGDARLYRPVDTERHLRVRFLLDDGRELWFTDPRRFGRGLLLGADELDRYFADRLGVEPLTDDFTAATIAEAAHGRSAPLKSFLLDQSRIAGIGNIYADEALFMAGLHPLSPAGSMRPEHHGGLRDAVVCALEKGIENGGASIDDYRDSRGEMGSMQNEFLVHRRAAEPCPECGTAISKIVVGGRATYFCATCQVRLRKRAGRN